MGEMKVYCGNCKHLMRDEIGLDQCWSNPAFRNIYFGRAPIYAYVGDKNGSGGCPDWAPNRRYRLRRWLTALCWVAVGVQEMMGGR